MRLLSLGWVSSLYERGLNTDARVLVCRRVFPDARHVFALSLPIHERMRRLDAVIDPSIMHCLVFVLLLAALSSPPVMWTGAVKASLAWEPKVAGLVNLWCAPTIKSRFMMQGCCE